MSNTILGFDKDKKIIETYSKNQVDNIISNLDLGIENGTVTTAKIANEAITTEKLANGSVEYSKIAHEAVYSTGIYIGNGAEKTIELGFCPSAMTIIGDNNYIIVHMIGGHYVSHYYDDTEQKIVSGSGDLTRSSTGITIDDFGGFNVQGETYSYIAYR